jgi:hypothetical protein
MRPLRHEHDLQLLEVFLPPTSQLTEQSITALSAEKNSKKKREHEVRGVVQSGTLLIVLNNDEYRAKTGDEFCFDGAIPHIYRNYTTEPVIATLIITNAGI